MDLRNKRIVLTGAGGGIGSILGARLAAEGARLYRLVPRTETNGHDANMALGPGGEIFTLACDITQDKQRSHAVQTIRQAWGGIDVLINLAGVLDFRPYQDEDPAVLQRMIQVNVEAPMQLVRAFLPEMLAQGSGRIVNVGSMFGSIGFPYFAAYSATKFALRGYSQALRRELAGSGVGVTYISPRAVNTPLNPPIVHEMAARGMMKMDEPEPVARAIVRAIAAEKSEVYLGFPESLFARVNALFPGLVDRALARQRPHLQTFAAEQKA